jgi:phosphoribosylformylglycinamidine cyclo-ligase
VLFETAGLGADTWLQDLGATVGEALLATHRSYLSQLRPLLKDGLLKGLAHITGGGITENLPRVLPAGCGAEIDPRAWTVPPIFRIIQERGGIANDEMFRTFNMGIGLIAACAASDEPRVLALLRDADAPDARAIGTVEKGSGVDYR